MSLGWLRETPGTKAKHYRQTPHWHCNRSSSLSPVSLAEDHAEVDVLQVEDADRHVGGKDHCHQDQVTLKICLLLLFVFVFVFTWMSSNMKTTPTT